MLERDGSVLAVTGPVRPSYARLRRAQALANHSGAALQIARELITQKMAGQERVANDLLSDSNAARIIASARNALTTAETIPAIRLLESQAALAYWSAWRAVPVMYPKNDLRRAPDHWRTFGTRVSPLTGSPRLASETCLTAAAMGLDPGIGLLHVDTARTLARVPLSDGHVNTPIDCVVPTIRAWVQGRQSLRGAGERKQNGDRKLGETFDSVEQARSMLNKAELEAK